MNAPIPFRCVPVDPDVSAKCVANIAALAGLDAAESYTARQVVQMMRAAGYACTLNTLREFISKRYISPPTDMDAWDSVYVWTLANALESRRRWQPTPNPRHDVKKSVARLEIERQVAAGEPAIADIDQYTVEDLLIQLVNCDQRGIREALYEAVKLKLDGLEE